MPDPRIARLAQTLVQYCVEVKPGETVLLTGDLPALSLIRETYREAINAGGHVVVALNDEAMGNYLLRHGSAAQLEWIAPLERWSAEGVDTRIAIRASSNTRANTSLPPKRAGQYGAARRDLGRSNMARAASGALRWTVTLFPTEAYAQEADMSLEEFEDFVYSATFADQPDPVARWQAVGESQQKYVDWLKGHKNITVRGPNIDMTLSIEGRTFINSNGKRNMPSGEIFTGPVEDSANGWVRFTYPAILSGRIVEGIELKFENGQVVSAKAAKNEAYLLSQLDSDPGARYLGEWAIGTNYNIQRFTGNILFDEKIGGTIHMAVGRGYPETGSRNESAIHWDMICDMRTDSEILVDGELLYRNGQFTF